MDLAAFDTVQDGVFHQLRSPINGEPLVDAGTNEPVGLQLVGTDSDAFRERQRKLINRRIRAGKKITLTAETIENDKLDTLAACVIGWKNIEVDGKPFPYSHENAKVLLQRYAFIQDQVDEAIADRANFLKDSAKN